MAGTHALLSPSSAEKWMGCPGSIRMEIGEADSGSEYADEGTAAHFLAAHCLATDTAPSAYFSRGIIVSEAFTGWAAGAPAQLGGRHFVVDTDMATYVATYCVAAKGYAAHGNLFIEQRLPITTWTGEPDAYGTSDAVVLTKDGELIVIDLKYGMGEQVSPEGNKQLMIYALAAHEEFQLVGDIKSVRLVIHQPRVHHAPSEWPVPLDELLAFGEEVKVAARIAIDAYNSANEPQNLLPSDDACRWCRAKHKCPALSQFVTDTVGASFDDLTEPTAVVAVAGDDVALATKMAACDLIEKWVKAIRGKVESELLAGSEVPGYKLVQGKRGNRAWRDPVVAEAALKSMRLKVEEMYDLKLISPTTAEKFFGEKGAIPSVKRWNRLQELITQKEGGPSVAPASDKRPTWAPAAVADAFDDATGEDMA